MTKAVSALTDYAFDEWHRKGAPQVYHSHAFLARLRNLLRDRAPDVLARLLAEGATELRFAETLPATMPAHDPMPGDEDLVALACRRLTFEWVLRRIVLDEGAVDLRDHVTVTGLTGEGASDIVPTVTGVMTDAGPIDCLGTPAGTDGFADLDASATDEDLDGLVIRVASLDDLIRMKRAADRPQDRIAIEWLSALRDELES